jgi:nucleotide-binding universal stress UspA family protein
MSVSIKRILCPIDFSEFSKHAFDRAVAIAQTHNATVEALHVVPAPSGMAAVPFGPEGPGGFALQEIHREHLLQEMKRVLSAGHPLTVTVGFHAIESPAVDRAILAQANSLAADLIVMGTHGRSGFDRLLLGSVTEKILRRAKLPVLTVSSHVRDTVPPSNSSFQQILCAVDFSAASLDALRYAAALAQESRASLTVLHVVELLPVVYEPSMATPFDPQRYWPALEESSRRQLHATVPAWVRTSCKLEEVVVSGKAYIEILKTAGERQADLIVLGIHGHSMLGRLFFGSTTGHVVRDATCAVLTVGRSGTEG